MKDFEKERLELYQRSLFLHERKDARSILEANDIFYGHQKDSAIHNLLCDSVLSNNNLKLDFFQNDFEDIVKKLCSIQNIFTDENSIIYAFNDEPRSGPVCLDSLAAILSSEFVVSCYAAKAVLLSSERRA
jgi:hypothetical protein